MIIYTDNINRYSVFCFILVVNILICRNHSLKFTYGSVNRRCQTSSISLNSVRHPERGQPAEYSLKEYESKRFINGGLFPLLTLAGIITRPLSARARKGAFEMDAEFYIRDLIRGNNVESTTTKRKPVFGSPRTLDPALSKDIVDAVHQQISRLSGVSLKDVTSKVNENVPLYIPKFTDYVPIKNRDLSDQYFFDITLYVSYLLAAELIPDPVRRIPLRKGVGNDVLKLLQKRRLIDLPSSSTTTSSNNSSNNDRSDVNSSNGRGSSGSGGGGSSNGIGGESMTATAAAEKMVVLSKGVAEILKAFTATSILGAYEFDEEDLSDFTFAKASFSDGLPVSFQITLKNPATILGFLEQTAANSFFHPEIIATTIANYARTLGFRAHYEDYLMDNFYLYDQEENEVTAQDVILEMEVALQSSELPDF